MDLKEQFTAKNNADDAKYATDIFDNYDYIINWIKSGYESQKGDEKFQKYIDRIIEDTQKRIDRLKGGKTEETPKEISEDIPEGAPEMTPDAPAQEAATEAA